MIRGGFEWAVTASDEPVTLQTGRGSFKRVLLACDEP
jgi:hypothetical protein